MDLAKSREGMGVRAGSWLMDGRAIGKTVWTIRRFGELATAELKHKLGRAPILADFRFYGYRPYEETVHEGNVITNAGWTRLMNLLIGTGSTQALTATAVRIGVGDGTDPADYTDTDLSADSGSTHRWFQPVNGAATLGTRTLSFEATFGASDANFDWNEFGIDVGTPTVSAGSTVNALLFNHAANINQGTKAAGQTWSATATITFS